MNPLAPPSRIHSKLSGRPVPLCVTLCWVVGGCLADSGAEQPPVPPGPVPSVTPAPIDPARLAAVVPVPAGFLDRKWSQDHGLLTHLTADGQPVRFGPDTDPRIIEARRFYDTLKTPQRNAVVVDYPDPFTGAVGGARETAPMTLDEWKRTFDFPLWQRDEGESLVSYRERAGIVVYYNKHELGLGRELGCSEFTDGFAADGTELKGVACYVTNYGTAFSDKHNSLTAAIDGVAPKNTVCISYRPSFEPDYQVQFYVYGPEGRRQEYAQLDSLGARPAPHICMNCHGGSYDETRHLAKHARFLPTDPSLLVFAEGPEVHPSLTRAGQEEKIRRINRLALRSPLASGQVQLLHGMYGDRIGEAGATAQDDFVPQGWAASQEDRDLYTKVVKPYCGTCHFADERSLSGNRFWFYDAFQSRAALAAAPSMATQLCTTFDMPNAQPTLQHFWGQGPRDITIGSKTFTAPVDALLALWGADRTTCRGDMQTVGDCRASADPDGACGNKNSGVACHPQTGMCVPNLVSGPPPDLAHAAGICRLDGSRTCSSGQECRPMDTDVEGFDGGCYTCGREGQPACSMSPYLCRDGMVVENGRCGRGGLGG